MSGPNSKTGIFLTGFMAICLSFAIYQTIKLHNVRNELEEERDIDEQMVSIENKKALEIEVLRENTILLSDQYETVLIEIDSQRELVASLRQKARGLTESIEQQKNLYERLLTESKEAARTSGKFEVLSQLTVQGSPGIHTEEIDWWPDKKHPFYQCSVSLAGEVFYSHTIWDLGGDGYYVPLDTIGQAKQILEDL